MLVARAPRCSLRSSLRPILAGPPSDLSSFIRQMSRATKAASSPAFRKSLRPEQKHPAGEYRRDKMVGSRLKIGATGLPLWGSVIFTLDRERPTDHPAVRKDLGEMRCRTRLLLSMTTATF